MGILTTSPTGGMCPRNSLPQKCSEIVVRQLRGYSDVPINWGTPPHRILNNAGFLGVGVVLCFCCCSLLFLLLFSVVFAVVLAAVLAVVAVVLAVVLAVVVLSFLLLFCRSCCCSVVLAGAGFK